MASSNFISELMNIRTLLDRLLDSQGASSGPSLKSGKEKKKSTRAGKPTPHGDFTKKVLAEHASEFETYKTQMKMANPEMKGIHLSFVGNYKKEHEEEYKTFEASWKQAHPKPATESVVGSGENSVAPSDSEGDAVPTTKKTRVLTEEQKAKMKAGREAAAATKKAAKEAGEAAVKDAMGVAPIPLATTTKVVKKAVKTAKKAEIVVPVVTTAVNEVDDPELLPFKHAGVNYLRVGFKRDDGNHLWSTSDLWMSNKGAQGAYCGALLEDGSINADAEEPDMQ